MITVAYMWHRLLTNGCAVSQEILMSKSSQFQTHRDTTLDGHYMRWPLHKVVTNEVVTNEVVTNEVVTT